jgi:hypothetical protein
MGDFVNRNVSEHLPGGLIAPERANAVAENLDSRTGVRSEGGERRRSLPESRIGSIHQLGLDRLLRTVGSRPAHFKLK